MSWYTKLNLLFIDVVWLMWWKWGEVTQFCRGDCSEWRRDQNWAKNLVTSLSGGIWGGGENLRSRRGRAYRSAMKAKTLPMLSFFSLSIYLLENDTCVPSITCIAQWGISIYVVAPGADKFPPRSILPVLVACLTCRVKHCSLSCIFAHNKLNPGVNFSSRIFLISFLSYEVKKKSLFILFLLREWEWLGEALMSEWVITPRTLTFLFSSRMVQEKHPSRCLYSCYLWPAREGR
jgi:hypothetical protein